MFGAREFEAKLGAFTADDTRSFSLAEINTSGVASALTTPLQGVPSVVGRTLDDARAALAARGFTVGKVTPVVSAQPAGTVVGPTAVQVLRPAPRSTCRWPPIRCRARRSSSSRSPSSRACG